MLVVHDFEVLV